MKKIWILPILSSIFLIIPFIYPQLDFLALLGLAPFLVFIYKGENLKKIFWTSWFSGFIFFAVIFEWILAAFPARWAGVESELAGLLLVLFVWLGSSAVMGLSFALFGALSYKLKTGTFYDLIIIPSIWIASQYVTAWIFSIWSWGSGGSLGAHWVFGNLGFALVEMPVVLWARIGGLYGVSFIAVFFNVFIFFILLSITFPTLNVEDSGFISRRVKFDRRAGKLFLIFLISVTFFIFFPVKIFKIYPTVPALNIVNVQINNKDGIFYHNNLRELFDKAVFSGEFVQPDIIIFSEGAQIFSFFGAQEEELIKVIFPDKDKPGLLVTNTIKTLPENADVRKSFILYRNQKGELVDEQEKSFLVPTGEFMPVSIKGVLTIFGYKNILGRFDVKRTITPGNFEEKPVNLGPYKVGVLLCSGIITPVSYRMLALKGADIFMNSASQNIFSGEPFLSAQIKAVARMQAISHAKPFVQATSGGRSFFVDQNGKVVWEADSLDDRIKFLKVAPSPGKTIYTKFGDWPLIFAVFVILGAILLKNRGFLVKFNRSMSSVKHLLSFWCF
ncbi:MAG: hypothetical protein COU46_02100 [Candidatus Niyogibacteria bacterium CG10_big_fil_rev_8_21_14_0_10_42_19]|uniref:CN hydrolase domain-containing protein n=1 Tax=Candidatus Niyogibacteria bacterium CG10_big_fil_rev_8_21_14_0_10_42_19 TaxID=1974725 RepID=A0A2H0TH63_9BACT|nr:MAG: hypothetical protein COU46_02100 [Candidatus Niyogibacteria bacterium CG10_big_fil_rev_8_21_14_0_10_42_19]